MLATALLTIHTLFYLYINMHESTHPSCLPFFLPLQFRIFPFHVFWYVLLMYLFYLQFCCYFYCSQLSMTVKSVACLTAREVYTKPNIHLYVCKYVAMNFYTFAMFRKVTAKTDPNTERVCLF